MVTGGCSGEASSPHDGQEAEREMDKREPGQDMLLKGEPQGPISSNKALPPKVSRTFQNIPPTRDQDPNM